MLESDIIAALKVKYKSVSDPEVVSKENSAGVTCLSVLVYNEGSMDTIMVLDVSSSAKMSNAGSMVTLSGIPVGQLIGVNILTWHRGKSDESSSITGF